MSNKKSVKKCSLKSGKWCDTIRDFSHVNDPESSGFIIQNMVNINTRREWQVLKFRFPRGQRKHFGGNGIWLHFCPFCGADVLDGTK